MSQYYILISYYIYEHFIFKCIQTSYNVKDLLVQNLELKITIAQNNPVSLNNTMKLRNLT